MVLVALGTIGKPIVKIAYDAFDDIQVLSYNNLNDFMRVVNMHTMEIHRMIMSDNAFDMDTVSDEVIDAFVNLMQVNYPAAKVITVSKSKDMTEYFAQLLAGIDYVHICIGEGENKFKATHKFLEDLISLSAQEIKTKYKNIVYNRTISVSRTEVDIIDSDVIEPVSNSEIEGYVENPNAGKEPKRSFFERLIGKGPKQSSNKSVLKQGGPTEIGQGYGVQEFSDNPYGNVFGADTQENVVSDEEFDDNDGEFSFFDRDESDIGLGEIDIPEQTVEEKEPINEEENGSEDIQNDNEYKDEKISENLEESLPEAAETEDSNTEQGENPFDFIGDDSESENVEDKNDFVPPIVAPIDISQIRDRIENTNLNIDMNNMPRRPNRSNMPLDVVEADDLGDFADNFDNLMSDFEESSRKIVEKKVVETKYVTVGNVSKFRNKNGVRIIVMTGDRRVGTTKLALNLCAKFSKGEKVLYVDFDRYRHGCLGYIDLDNILEEPDHISDGFNHYKNNKILNNIVHLYDKGGFYTLSSMYGSDITDEQMNLVEKLLVSQQDFQTVIVDCPIENMYLLDDILRVSNVIICAEDDKVGILNLLTSLGLYSSDTKKLLNIFEKSSFVVGRKNNIEKFSQALLEAVDLFDMSEAGMDWSKVEVIGTTKNVAGLAERMSN